MKVLEIGRGLAVAYAGQVLAEQKHKVVKWWRPDAEPMRAWRHGSALIEWLNADKVLVDRGEETVTTLQAGDLDVVLDSVPASVWEARKVNRALLAGRWGVVWVALEGPDGQEPNDAVAQAQATMAVGPYVPWHLGDTALGLWAAFAALQGRVAQVYGLRRVHQPTALAKLVEGELGVRRPPMGAGPPWAVETYGPWNEDGQVVGTEWEGDGEVMREPTRDRDWQRAHLRIKNGRLVP